MEASVFRSPRAAQRTSSLTLSVASPTPSHTTARDATLSVGKYKGAVLPADRSAASRRELDEILAQVCARPCRSSCPPRRARPSRVSFLPLFLLPSLAVVPAGHAALERWRRRRRRRSTRLGGNSPRRLQLASRAAAAHNRRLASRERGRQQSAQLPGAVPRADHLADGRAQRGLQQDHLADHAGALLRVAARDAGRHTPVALVVHRRALLAVLPRPWARRCGA